MNSKPNAGLPLEDNGVRSASRYSSVAFLRTTILRLRFSDVSESSWRELHSIHESGGTTSTSGRGFVCLPFSQGLGLAGMKDVQ